MQSSKHAVLERFTQHCRDLRQTQEETLRRILRRTAGGAFGREYGFDKIDSVDEYRRRVPLSTYEDLRTWLERDLTALIGERPRALLRTSSSTGKAKLVPFGEQSREATHAGYEVYTAGLFRDYPYLVRRPGEPPMGIGLYQHTTDDGSLEGIPYDTYISQFCNLAMPEDPFFNCFEQPISKLVDANDRLYAMALRAAAWPHLRAVRATNPTTLLLFARLLAEQTPSLLVDLAAGRASARPKAQAALEGLLTPQPELARRLAALGRPLRPTDLWPKLELAIAWRMGACDKFSPFIREYYGPVHVRSLIFSASEGMMALPLDHEGRHGALAIESTFFEFRPVDTEGSQTLLAHELEVGGRYELIMTSPSGMFRYLIGDLIDVETKLENTPCVTFVARKGRTSSLTGEKLTELQVEEAVAAVERELGIATRFFVLSPRFGAVPSYVLSVEWSTRPPPALVEKCAARIEAELQRMNIEYRAKRESHRLDPLALNEVVPGDFERLFTAGMSSGTNVFKLPHLTSEPMHERLAAIPR